MCQRFMLLQALGCILMIIVLASKVIQVVLVVVVVAFVVVVILVAFVVVVVTEFSHTQTATVITEDVRMLMSVRHHIRSHET
jgi:hypothetical protein